MRHCRWGWILLVVAAWAAVRKAPPAKACMGPAPLWDLEDGRIWTELLAAPVIFPADSSALESLRAAQVQDGVALWVVDVTFAGAVHDEGGPAVEHTIHHHLGDPGVPFPDDWTDLISDVAEDWWDEVTSGDKPAYATLEGTMWIVSFHSGEELEAEDDDAEDVDLDEPSFESHVVALFDDRGLAQSAWSTLGGRDALGSALLDDIRRRASVSRYPGARAAWADLLLTSDEADLRAAAGRLSALGCNWPVRPTGVVPAGSKLRFPNGMLLWESDSNYVEMLGEQLLIQAVWDGHRRQVPGATNWSGLDTRAALEPEVAVYMEALFPADGEGDELVPTVAGRFLSALRRWSGEPLMWYGLLRAERPWLTPSQLILDVLVTEGGLDPAAIDPQWLEHFAGLFEAALRSKHMPVAVKDVPKPGGELRLLGSGYVDAGDRETRVEVIDEVLYPISDEYLTWLNQVPRIYKDDQDFSDIAPHGS